MRGYKIFLDEKKERRRWDESEEDRILAEMPASDAGMSPVSFVCLISLTALKVYKHQSEMNESIKQSSRNSIFFISTIVKTGSTLMQNPRKTW
jgi:hypothetical protein